jgi:hypothetical protein
MDNWIKLQTPCITVEKKHNRFVVKFSEIPRRSNEQNPTNRLN